MDNIKLLLICILRVLLLQYFFINVYMVLFLRRGTVRTLPICCVALCIFVLFYVFLCSLYCLICDVSCIVCVYMCTEQLPPGGYPIAVKYISYHNISYHIK